jgi:hypothetical protein
MCGGRWTETRAGPRGARCLVQLKIRDLGFRLNFWRLGKARGRLTCGPRGVGCLGTVRTALGPALTETVNVRDQLLTPKI